MTKLSVNLNKAALLRNSRGCQVPDLKYIADLLIAQGCQGITLHPREDGRHATIEDIAMLSELPEVRSRQVELNIEGDLRPEVLEALQKYNVHQFTIVPVKSGEKTTERGFQVNEEKEKILAAIKLLKLKKDIRISLFIEAVQEAVNYAHVLGCDAVEFHTKWYAKAFCTHNESAEVNKLRVAASLARELGMRVHLGHDLSLANISTIIDKIRPDEVSVGHWMITEALLQGLPRTFKKYLHICNK